MPQFPHRVRRFVRSLLLTCLLILGVCATPPALPVAASNRATPATVLTSAHSTAVRPEEVAAFLGEYSPNTFVELRGDQLWFSRPPFESQLLPVGNGAFLFAQGWLTGLAMQFAPNEVGGISILIQSADGAWHEFARSGEIYPDLGPALIADLEHVLERALADQSLPGAVLYVHIPGRGMWLGARGLADRGRGIPMVPLDRIRIASVSKTFVATIVLQLMQEGWLTLDDTVERWLPGLVPNGDRMNLRHLLNHTSGLYNYLDNGFVNSVQADPGRIWQPEELVAVATAHEPYFGPGEPGRWRYSNTNYVLLGMVVERVTGNSLVSEIRSRILNPLNLYNTYFDPYESLPGGTAHGYAGNRDYTNLNLSFAWSAGNLVSTAEDLGRFADALFGGALLGSEALNTMLAFTSVHGEWGARNLVYGMGVMQDQMGITAADPAALGVVRGHTGALTGFRTAMWYLPQSGITLVAGVNQMYADPNEIITDAMNVVLAQR